MYAGEEYFLYVGKSRAQYARCSTHSKKYAFDYIYLFECASEHLQESEAAVISELKPLFNRSNNPDAKRIKRLLKVDYEANQSADAIRAYLERYTHYNNKGLFGFVLSRTVFAALEYASALKNCDCSALLQQILEKEFEEIIPTELDKCVTTETNLLSTQQYAALHKRSPEQVKQYLHQNNRIPGAIRIGRDWVISKDARFPENKRKTNLNKED